MMYTGKNFYPWPVIRDKQAVLAYLGFILSLF
jgi:hypothetical protein